MDGRCCLGCGRPAAYTFTNHENGYQDEMCREHSQALDARNKERFIELDGPSDAATMQRRREVADAYSRHKLEGHRIPPERTVDGASLVTERQMEEMARRREEIQARKWEQSIERDPWVR
jgi:hypothetical protein